MKKSYSPKSLLDSDLCIGCGICVAHLLKSGKKARMNFDPLGQLKPHGPYEWLVRPSESFSRICPFSPSAKNEDVLAEELFPDVLKYAPAIGRYIKNYAGYASEDEFRSEGSSGGMVSWIASMLLRSGMVDGIVHVVPEKYPQEAGTLFGYKISRTENEVREGARSRYYPVELSGALQSIRETPGRYAVVAIPCMIKAIHLICDIDPVLKDRIRFALGLFCGHMKSSRFAESIAWQMGVSYKKVRSIDFRHKYNDRPANWYNARITTADGKSYNKDWWHLADGDWGAGFFMNNACNFCDDVVAETADISFGDAWVEPYASDGRGTNVVIVRSEIFQDIITSGLNSGRLNLDEVDAELVERTQAAGLRMRREGLSWRLSVNGPGIIPVKRVEPDTKNISVERKRIYRLRMHISKWSHRVFRIARVVNIPFIYLAWARLVTSIYHGMAYHKGKISEMKKRYDVMKKG